MSLCPKCNNPLSPDDLQVGQCASCGQLLAESDGRQTIDEHTGPIDLDKTTPEKAVSSTVTDPADAGRDDLESTQRNIDATTPADDGNAGAQTIDESTLPPPEDNSALKATVDSSEIPGGISLDEVAETDDSDNLHTIDETTDVSELAAAAGAQTIDDSMMPDERAGSKATIDNTTDLETTLKDQPGTGTVDASMIPDGALPLPENAGDDTSGSHTPTIDDTTDVQELAKAAAAGSQTIDESAIHDEVGTYEESGGATIDDTTDIEGLAKAAAAGSQTIDESAIHDEVGTHHEGGGATIDETTDVGDLAAAAAAGSQTIDEVVLPQDMGNAGQATIDETTMPSETSADSRATISEQPGTGTVDASILPEGMAEELAGDANSQTIDETTPAEAAAAGQTIDESTPLSADEETGPTVGDLPGTGTIDSSLLPHDVFPLTGPPTGNLQTVDESLDAGNKTVDESVGNKTVDESVGNQTVDESMGNKTVDESVGNQTVADASIMKTTDSAEGIVLPESADTGAQTIDESSAPRGDDESKKTVSDRPGMGTVDGISLPDEVGKHDTADIGATVESIDLSEDMTDTGKTVSADTTKTIDAASISDSTDVSQTVDSVDLGDVPGLDNVERTETGTVQDRPKHATIDSQPGQQDEGTVKSRQDKATIDSQYADSDQMEKMWGGAEQRDLNPRMTIKGKDDSVSPGKTTLVIQSRAFRDAAMTLDAGADYDLLRKLGEGGMGVVYMARQASIDRTVAIKMLKPNFSADATQMNKFLAEAVITGDLEHPNIVPIYDLGKNDDGALFYAMKRVKGTPWDEVVADKSLVENLEILLKVCDAVAFAHSRGIIHRDLKPENTMLGDFGEVLVMDWGLALPYGAFEKRSTINTTAGMGGTPAYMAPEMATGPFDKMGVTSDVYLLGAMLFEIITGKPPHSGKDVMKCLFAAAKNEIVKTDKSGELLEIALTAMETRTQDRYQSVQDFQKAIRAYEEHSESIAMVGRATDELEHATKSDSYDAYSRAVFGFEEALALWDGNDRAREGIQMSQLAYATSAYHKGDLDLGLSLLNDEVDTHVELKQQLVDAQEDRLAKQRRLKTAMQTVRYLAATVFIAITIGLGVALVLRQQAIESRNVAIQQKGIADQKTRVAKQAQAEEARQKAKAVAARDLAQQKTIEAEMARADEERQRKEAIKQREKAIEAKKFAEQKTVEAEMARAEEEKQRKEAVTQREIAETERTKAEYQAYVALIGLASAKIDENAFVDAVDLLNSEICKPELRGWEWGRLMHLCTQMRSSADTNAPIEAVAYSPDGKLYAAGGWAGTVIVWDAETQQEVTRIQHGTADVFSLAFSHDSGHLVTGSSDPENGYLRIWDPRTGKPVSPPIKGHEQPVTAVAYSPQDSKLLLSASFDHTARLWNVEDPTEPQLVRELAGHTWWVRDAAFSPDGKRIVTAGQEGTVYVWDVETGAHKPAFTGHQGAVFAASFTGDGRRVVSGGYDRRILIWDPDDLVEFDYNKLIEGEESPLTPFEEMTGHSYAIRALAAREIGGKSLIVSCGDDNTVRLWDAAILAPLQVMRGHGSAVHDVALAPDGDTVLSGGYDKREQVRTWSIDGYLEARVLQGRIMAGHRDAIMAARFSPSGDQIVTASRDRTAITWNARTGERENSFSEGHSYLASDAAFTNDGTRLITSAVDNSARIWNVASGVEEMELTHTGRLAALAISADGKWALTGNDDHEEREKAEQENRQQFPRSAQLWNAETGELVKVLTGHKGEVSAVAFSPDGRYCYTADRNGREIFWSLKTLEPLATKSWHMGRVSSARFLPDGKSLLSASDDKTVVRWNLSQLETDADSVKPDLKSILKHPNAIISMEVSRDGRYALTCCVDQKVRYWDLNSTEKPLRVLDFTEDTINSSDLDATGKRAITVHADSRTAEKNRIRLWNLETGKELSEVNPGGLLWSAVFAPDGDAVLAVGGADARLYQLGTEGTGEVVSFSPHSAVASAAYSPDGRHLVTASWDKSAKIWEVASGRGVRQLRGGHSGFVNTAFYSPDGQTILTASDDGTAVLWNAGTAEVIRRFEAEGSPVRYATFSSDGSRIVTASEDKQVRVFDTETGALAVTMKGGHLWGVLCAVFSADGKFIASGSEDNTARIWNAETGDLKAELTGHTASVSSVAFSPDGSRVLTASADSTAKLFDVEEGREILNLKGHEQEVTSVDFSKDGRYALTGSRDGTAILWLTSPWSEDLQGE